MHNGQLAGVVYKDADVPFGLLITQQAIENGKCSDPHNCVIAQSLKDHYGWIDDVEIGMWITKIWSNDRRVCVRYVTPKILREALRSFDETGSWKLPPGKFNLFPPKGTERLKSRPWRRDRIAKTKTQPGQDSFNGRALPTRKISRAALEEAPRFMGAFFFLGMTLALS